jgi:hypothetical protein
MKVVKDLTTNSNSTSVSNPLENIPGYFFVNSLIKTDYWFLRKKSELFFSSSFFTSTLRFHRSRQNEVQNQFDKRSLFHGFNEVRVKDLWSKPNFILLSWTKSRRSTSCNSKNQKEKEETRKFKSSFKWIYDAWTSRSNTKDTGDVQTALPS